MNSMWKAFLFFSFAVFFLSGCGKSNSHQAKVAPADKSANQGQNKKLKEDDRKIDVSELSKEEQEKIFAVAKDVKALIRMNKKADQVFTQAWGAYWEDFNNKRYSVFRAVRLALESSYSEDGLPLRTLPDQKCKNAELNTISINNMTKAPTSYTLIEGTCSKLAESITAEIKVGNDDKGRLYYEINFAREAMWIGKLLSAFGGVRFNAEEKDADKAYIFEQKMVTCYMFPDASAGLADLKCTELGQDKSTDTYLYFQSLNWTANKETKGLQAKGYKIANGERGVRPLTSFTMVEDSKENTISIDEKEIANREEKTRKVKKPAPPPPEEIKAAANPDAVLAEAVISAENKIQGEARMQEYQQDNIQAPVSGDQAVDPSQINAVTGEIIPLKDFETEPQASSQAIPGVR